MELPDLGLSAFKAVNATKKLLVSGKHPASDSLL
jgi:hypothetical protein